MDETPDRPAEIRHYRHLAKKIIETHFGKPPSRIVYKRSGKTNFVFAVNHVEGQFVVRLTPEKERIDAFRKELWTSHKVREAGVPSPEVLAVGNDQGPEPYMITRRVTGSEATEHPRRRHIVHEMGRYAQIINSIHTEHFGGDFDWNTYAPKKRTWSEYLDEEWQVDRKLKLLGDHKILSKQDLIKLREIVDETRTNHITPTLNHGDLRLKNVIVDEDGEIAAILDWDDAISSIAPQWELSIALHDLSIDEKHLFLEGYGINAEDLTKMAPLIKAFNIINYSAAIERAIDTKDHKTLGEIKLRMSSALDLYSLT
ncbi:MAG TPA: aminoglycoside phosphotransferase family protein [Pyrinomonadaceae bacterium]|nr:aminoglycoside phosphotransferase family protein [Pyrinomonadaceae bacterium]